MKNNMLIGMFVLGASLFVFAQGMEEKLEPKKIVRKNQKILDKRVFDAIKNRDVTSLKKALQEGAKVNAKNENDFTPLHIAAFEGYDEIIEILLEHGADVNAKGGPGFRPLHFAVFRSYDKVVEILLKHGADVNAQDVDGKTPLHFAVLKGYDKVAEILLKHGADVKAQAVDGGTPLHFAVLRRYDKVAEILLKNGADVNAKNNLDETPLHLAAMNGYDKAVVILLDNKADIAAKTQDNLMPLDEAGKPAPNKDTFYISALIKLFPTAKQTQVNQLIQEAVQSDNPQAWLLGYFKAAYRLAQFKMIDALYDRMKQNKKLAQAISAFLLGKGAPAIPSHKALREAIANKALAEKDFALAAKHLAAGYPYDNKLASKVHKQAKSDTGKAGSMAYIKAYNQRQRKEKMMRAKKYFNIDLRQYTGM